MNSHHRMQNVRHRQMVQGYQPKPQPSNHRKQPQQGSWYQPPQPQQPQQRPWHRRAQPPPPLQPPPPPPPQRQQPSPPLQPPPPPLQPPPPPPQRPQPPPPLQPPPPPPPQRQQPPPPLQPPPPSPQRPQPLPPLQPPPPSPQRPQPPLRPVLSERPRLVEMPDNTLATVMAADGYRLGPTIGQGSYAKVRIATRDVPGGAAVTLACKIIDKKNGAGGDPSYLSKFLPRELDVLRRVRHPKLVATHSIYVTPSAVYVYMDYCKQGDLLQHLRRTNGIPLWQARTFFRQICDAVDYLHGSGISHRDIKCENILLDSMQVVKLADFGFARVSDGKDRLSNTHCGTPSYAAPEILQGKPYDPKAGDVWSLGVVLYVMLGNCLPFRNSPRMVSNQMAKKLKRPKKPMCRESTDLISIILEPDVSKRITIGQIKSHSWFDEINL